MAYADVVGRRLERIDEAARSMGLEMERVRTVVEVVAVGDPVSRSGGINAVERHVAATLALEEQMLPAIVSQLGVVDGTLQRIEELLSTPRATAARERRNEGAQLAQRGLFPEADRELLASIEQYGYDPVTWFLRGRVCSSLGRYVDAAESFHNVRRYTTDAAFVASAGLLEAASYLHVSDTQQAAAALEETSRQVPDCAEVWAALGRTTHDERAVERALSIGPDLIFDLVADGVAESEPAAKALLAQGRLAAARDATGAARALVKIAAEADIEIAFDIPSEPPESDSRALFAWAVMAERDAHAAIETARAKLDGVPLPPVRSKPTEKPPFPIRIGAIVGSALLTWPTTAVGLGVAAAAGLFHSGGSTSGGLVTFLILWAIGFFLLYNYLFARGRMRARRAYYEAVRQAETDASGHSRASARKAALVQKAMQVQVPEVQQPRRVIPAFA